MYQYDDTHYVGVSEAVMDWQKGSDTDTDLAAGSTDSESVVDEVEQENLCPLDYNKVESSNCCILLINGVHSDSFCLSCTAFRTLPEITDIRRYMYFSK